MSVPFIGIFKKLWQPQIHIIRLQAKINIEKPRHPHFIRDKVEKLCKPYFPKVKSNDPTTPQVELCWGSGIREKIDNPLEHLIAKEVFTWFTQHKFIFFFHLNSTKRTNLLETFLFLKKDGLTMRRHSKSIMHLALSGTIYEPTLILFQTHTVIGCGQDVKVGKLFKTLKKCPNIVLMAGVIEDRLLSLSELQYYANLPDLQTLRANLVSTLNTFGGKIIHHLNHHQDTLVQNLKHLGQLS